MSAASSPQEHRDAPAGYTFSGFDTFVEVSGGSVVAVEQFYTS